LSKKTKPFITTIQAEGTTTERLLDKKQAQEEAENLAEIFRNFQIQRELRNASTHARKILSGTYQQEYLTLIEKRLKHRGLSEESIETALLTVKKSLRR